MCKSSLSFEVKSPQDTSPQARKTITYPLFNLQVTANGKSRKPGKAGSGVHPPQILIGKAAAKATEFDYLVVVVVPDKLDAIVLKQTIAIRRVLDSSTIDYHASTLNLIGMRK